MLCLDFYFFGRGAGEQVGLLVIGMNCRIPVLMDEFALHTIVNSFNVECSRVSCFKLDF